MIWILESAAVMGLGLSVGYLFQLRAAIKGLIFLLFWLPPVFLDPLIWNHIYNFPWPLSYSVLLRSSFILNTWLAGLLVVGLILGRTLSKHPKEMEK